MASLLEGMFTTPQDIRNKRMDELLAERQAIGRMGGSFDQLLGQVAAGGSATGAMLAEGTAGMFGLQTPEEAKAAEVQGIMKGLQGNTDPQAYYSAAKQLNDMGYIRESIALIEQGKAAAQEQRAINQDTRSAEAAKRAEELFPIQRRGAELTNQNTQLNIEDATLARDREAKVAGIMRTAPTGLLADDPAQYYLTMGQKYATEGLREEANEAIKNYRDISKSKAADPDGRFTAVDVETGRLVRLGDVNGQLMQITGAGMTPYTGEFRNVVQRTSDGVTDQLTLLKFASSEFGPYKKATEAAESAVKNGTEALINPSKESRAKFEAQLNRSLATLVGDKQLSAAEVQMLTANGALTERIASGVNSYLNGTSTPQTLEGKIEVARVAQELSKIRLANLISDFDANFGADAVNIDSYRKTAGVMSSNASQYY